jgi:hypothetical protein
MATYSFISTICRHFCALANFSIYNYSCRQCEDGGILAKVGDNFTAVVCVGGEGGEIKLVAGLKVNEGKQVYVL